MSFQTTVLKVLAGHPGGCLSVADLRRAVAILISSGLTGLIVRNAYWPALRTSISSVNRSSCGVPMAGKSRKLVARFSPRSRTQPPPWLVKRHRKVPPQKNPCTRPQLLCLHSSSAGGGADRAGAGELQACVAQRWHSR